MTPPPLPSCSTALRERTGLFELVSISSDWTDPKDPNTFVWGFFWVFADALMWEVPNDAQWKFWKGTSVEQPLPRRPFFGNKIGDRKRLVRLPCTGHDAQEAADNLNLTQAQLIASDGSDFATPSPDDAPVQSLLLTDELYDITYLQADLRIPPRSRAVTKLLTADALGYAEDVAVAIDAAKPTTPGATTRLLGTPGKIWAIADRMDTWVCCCVFSKWEFACINHGFHESITQVPKKRPRANAIQERGGCHPMDHVDYSQIFSIVAGWCWVQGVGEAGPSWRRTAAIYRDPVLCNLVRDPRAGRATPAPAIRYHGKPPTPRPTTTCQKHVAPCPPPKNTPVG